MDTKTGWERNHRTHFDKIVANYDKIRWDYPGELFEDIFKYSGTGKGKKALEIGAGTGKATTPFLNAGYTVTAVEMGANMVESLLEKFKWHVGFSAVNSTFEDAALNEENYDLIYAASAFHWVDAEIGCPKVFKLLKSGGTFALFRNNAIPPDGNELYEESQAFYERYYYSYYKTNQRPIRKSKEDFGKPSEIYNGFRFDSLERYGFADVTMKLYEATRTYSADEYLALLDTYSDHIALPDDNRVALYAGIKEAIMRHGGHQKLDFVFQLYMGKKL
jgi:SAM-dependent methyltransferase